MSKLSHLSLQNIYLHCLFSNTYFLSTYSLAPCFHTIILPLFSSLFLFPFYQNSFHSYFFIFFIISRAHNLTFFPLPLYIFFLINSLSIFLFFLSLYLHCLYAPSISIIFFFHICLQSCASFSS